MSDMFRKLFELVTSIQVICTLVFLLREYTHLDAIRFIYVITWAITIDFTINFYFILGLIAVLFVIVIIASINVLGSGLNDIGGRSIMRFTSFIIAFLILSIGTGYYFQVLGSVVSGIWSVISAFAYILYITNTNTEIPV